MRWTTRRGVRGTTMATSDPRTDDELIEDLLSALAAALVCVVSSLCFGASLAVLVCATTAHWPIAWGISFVATLVSFLVARASLDRAIDYMTDARGLGVGDDPRK